MQNSLCELIVVTATALLALPGMSLVYAQQVEVQQSQSSTVNGQTQSVQTENGGKTIVETSHGTLKLNDDKVTYCYYYTFTDKGQNKHPICGPEYTLNTDGTITK